MYSSRSIMFIRSAPLPPRSMPVIEVMMAPTPPLASLTQRSPSLLLGRPSASARDSTVADLMIRLFNRMLLIRLLWKTRLMESTPFRP